MIHITEVTTKAQLRQFVNFPIDLYRDVPQYIPGTYSDDLADWDREKNPAFSYCEARCWLASRDDGTLVGRIGAILSRKSNDKWGTHRLRFTQVDFIDDREVSAALFQTVEDWARQLGCTEIHALWASPTWTGRGCWWRALTAPAASLPIITTPTILTT